VDSKLLRRKVNPEEPKRQGWDATSLATAVRKKGRLGQRFKEGRSHPQVFRGGVAIQVLKKGEKTEELKVTSYDRSDADPARIKERHSWPGRISRSIRNGGGRGGKESIGRGVSPKKGSMAAREPSFLRRCDILKKVWRTGEGQWKSKQFFLNRKKTRRHECY